MEQFDPTLLKNLYVPPLDSHKGQNGRLLVIGGSKLFHASIAWAATIASKVVDLVHFTSPVIENNDLMRIRAKERMWDGIVVPFEDVEAYIEEDDCVLIGPGMPRPEGLLAGEQDTGVIVNSLLSKFPTKRWVVDGGALQTMDVGLLQKTMILTPHEREFERLFGKEPSEKTATEEASFYQTTVVLKGPIDFVTNGSRSVRISGGNAGMTKGGTGDILAGLVAALYCKNDAWLSAVAASYFNKKAGERLSETVGPFFNAHDLITAIPPVIFEAVKTT